MTKKKNTLTRIEWLDMAKGYGIIVTIFAHLMLNTLLEYSNYMYVARWIYTFNVPLFFFLSGYTFNNKYKFKELIKKKTKSLLIPYFIYSLIISIYYFIANYISSNVNFLFFLKCIFNFIIQIRCETLWFIACLFFLNIIFYFLLKKVKSMKKIFLIVILLFIIGLMYYKLGGISLPWNIDVCLTGILYFYGGYCLRNNYNEVKKYVSLKMSILYFICLLIINISCGYLSYYLSGVRFDMFYNDYGIPIFSCLSSFAGIGMIIIISHWFTLKSITYIGKNSIIYYAVHQAIMISILRNIFYNLKFGIYNIYSSFSLRFLELILILIILTIINEIIKKIKFIISIRLTK